MRNGNFEFGEKIICEGRVCGRLAAITVKPATAEFAHLIVNPGHGKEPRLIPAIRAHPNGDGIVLDYTRQQFDNAEPAVITHVEPPDAEPTLDEERRWRRHDEISSWPAFGLGPTVLNPSIGTPAPSPRPHIEFEDHVPAGEVRIRGRVSVHAADGDVGKIAGATTDSSGNQVTHILVDEGHLWSRKRVAIPLTRVQSLDAEGIEVRLSKQQIKELPPVDGESA